MARLSDYMIALSVRDTMDRLARQKLEEERPAPRDATVVTIDRTGRRCEVQYPTDVTPTWVDMMAVQPASVGQIVRVDGPSGDRYVDQVFGPVIVDQGIWAPYAIVGSTADITNPYEGQRAYETSTKKTLTYDSTSTLWVAPPGLELDYAENITSTSVTVTGTANAQGTLTDITGVSISVPATTRPVYLEAECTCTQITNTAPGVGLLFIVETTSGSTIIGSRPTQLPGSFTTRENSFAIRAKFRIAPLATPRTFKLQCRADSSTATVAAFNVLTIPTVQPWLVAFAA